MCGECCKRYMIPVNLSDIYCISAFTGLNPTQYLKLVTPHESIAYTYYDIPKIELQNEANNVLVLKEKNDGCMFLKKKKCSIHQAKPLRCRPFPFSYERKRGKIVFSANEEALKFCKGLGRRSGRHNSAELTNVVIAMEAEQGVFRKRVEEWNTKVGRKEIAGSAMRDLLKFLLLNIKYIRSQSDE